MVVSGAWSTSVGHAPYRMARRLISRGVARRILAGGIGGRGYGGLWMPGCSGCVASSVGCGVRPGGCGLAEFEHLGRSPAIVRRRVGDRDVVATTHPRHAATVGRDERDVEVGRLIPLGIDDEVTSDASFIDDLNADSLDLVELIMSLEEEFNVKIPDDDAEKIRTVRDAMEYLNEHMS